jgi:hypothetical protein
MPALAEAYMAWMLCMGEDGINGIYTAPQDAEIQGSTGLIEVDLFRTSQALL